MPPSLIETLRTANYQLRAELSHLDAGSSPIAPNLPGLLAQISQTSEALRGASPSVLADPQLQQELSHYRNQLEQLRQVLPGFHVRLQVEKARLRAALDHLHSVSAWARSNHP